MQINVDKNISNFLALGEVMTKYFQERSENHNNPEVLAKTKSKIEKELDSKGVSTLIYANGIPGSGIDSNGKITIAGKLLGLDPEFDDKKINSLKAFMKNESFVSLGEPIMNAYAFKLLDRSDLSIDEFKRLWSENQQSIKNNFKNANQHLNKPQSKNNKFKPIQATSKSTTYKDVATNELKKLYEFIEQEFNQGKDIFEILKKVAKRRIDIKA